MQTQLSNASSLSVTVTAGGREVAISPGQTVSLVDCGTVRVRPAGSSYVSRRWKETGVSHLVLEARYDLSGVSGQVLVTREHIRFEANAWYDRVFLSAGTEEEVRVFDPGEARRSMKKYRLLENWVLEPLFDGCWEIPAILIVSGLLALAFGPIMFFAAAVCAWLLLAAVHNLLEFVSEHLWTRLLKQESRQQELERFCDPAFIAAYYARESREPWLGKAER